MASKTPEEWFAAILAEDERYDAYDSEFSANPYSPWRIADDMARDLGSAAVPFLLAKLDTHRKFAVHVLREIGAFAGPSE